MTGDTTSEASCDTIRLWHMRLAHISEKGLALLSKDMFNVQKIRKVGFL